MNKEGNKITRILTLLILVLGSVVFCHAQFNSSVEGTVQDPSGAAIPKAQVTLRDTQTGVKLQTTTNEAGLYRFNAVAPSSYQVIVHATGFKTTTVGVQVTSSQNAGVNVTLPLGASSTTVQVTGQGSVLNPDETRIETTILASQLKTLPLQNGSVLNVLKTAPGVTGIDEDRTNWAINIGGSSPTAAANGRTADANLYLMDGASIQSNTLCCGQITNRQVEITPNQDMVEQISVATQTYSATNGAGSSMRVNFATKSGTNSLHGDVGLRYVSRGLVAVPDFASANSPFKRTWWTGALGGPIVKNRTFFFFSYEHQTQAAALSSLLNYTSPEFTQWAVQNYPNSLDVNKLMAAFPADRVDYKGVAVHAGDVYPPDGSGACSITNHSAVFGPVTGQTPIPCGLPLLDEGVFNQAPAVDGWQVFGRLDQYFRDGKDRVYVSYLQMPQQSDFLWWHSGYNAHTPSAARYGNLNYTHIFTPNLLDQASLTYQRYDGSFTASKAVTIPFLTLILGPGAANPGTDFFGTPGPTNSKEHDYVIRNNLTWTHQNHNFQFGFQAEHKDFWNDASGFDARPSVALFFTWNDFFDDLPFAYNLNTLSAATGKYLPQIYGAQVTQFGAYVQDDWKVTPNLLLTLGVRWDDFGNPYDYGKGALPFAQVFPGSGSTFAEQISNSYVKVVHNAFSGRMNHNILPRFGFAWSPRSDQKMSVRGGVGFYEDALNLGGITGSLPTQPPVDLNLSLSVFNPAPLNQVSAANLYGTSTASPPYGITYPSITPLGFDSRGAVIRGVDPETGENLLYPATLSGVDRKLGPQKTTLYSLRIEHQIPWNMVVGVGYSGSYSWDMNYGGDFNTVPGDLIAHNGTQTRLTGEWGPVNFTKNGMSANYNALLMTFRQRQGRLDWEGSFTWAKSLDDPIEENSNHLLPNPYDFHNLYGPSDHDIPLSFNGRISYELPGPEHNWELKNLFGGWVLSGLTTGQQGPPFTVYSSAPWNTSGDTSDPRNSGDYLANGINYALPNVPQGTKRSGFSRQQFKDGIFPGYTANSTPPIGQSYFTNPVGYGTEPVESNQGRNTFRNPGYWDVDAALHKTFVIPWFGSEKSNLMLGVEGTNVLNRANLGWLSNNPNDGADMAQGTNFGVIKNANQARVFQLVGKISF